MLLIFLIFKHLTHNLPKYCNKATNYYEKLENGRKVEVKQEGINWAIRKSLHTPMPYGKKVYEFDVLKIAENVGRRALIIDEIIRDNVEAAFKANGLKITDTQKFLKEQPIKDEKGNQIIATTFKVSSEKYRRRQPLLELANRGKGGIKNLDDAVKFINKVADVNIRQDLLCHLKSCNNDIESAFSAEGLENFNLKRKIPVHNLPIAESGTGRFPVGNRALLKKYSYVVIPF